MRNKLFFGGLAWATTDASLHAACERFGDIQEARIITDRETGRSKGFGFVTFTTEEAATRAKDELDGTMLDGRAVKVDYPREREPGQDRGPRPSFDRGAGGGGGYDRGPGGGGYERAPGGGGGYDRAPGGGGGYDRGGGGFDRPNGGGYDPGFDRGDRSSDRGARGFDRDRGKDRDRGRGF